MISFPNAKINLGLHVHRRRPDGFHDMESCILPVRWNDVLEIIESKEERLTISGLPIPGRQEDNLCWKVYKLIKQDHSIPPVNIHLHKMIPMGGGIGGGSSDAAYTIKTLNNIFSLEIGVKEMESYAAKIGSDCPFFIKNQIVIATGRGTELKSFNLELSSKFIVLVNPGLHISTAEAYSGIVTGEGKKGQIEEILKSPVEQWKGLLKNDFEAFVFKKHPEISHLKDALYESGAIYASMSGSGATVYGIFDGIIPDIKFPDNYLTWTGEL